MTELLLLFPLLLLRSKIVCKLPSSSFKIFKDLGSTAREPSFPFATAFFKGASALSSENFCSNSSLNSATILPGLNEIRQNKRYQQLQELHLTLEMAWLHNFAQIRVTSHVTRHTSHVTEHDQCQVFVDVPPSVSPGRGGGEGYGYT